MEEIPKIILHQTVGTMTSVVVKLGFEKLLSCQQNRLGSLLGDGEQQKGQGQRQISTFINMQQQGQGQGQRQISTFINMYSLVALAAVVAFFFAYWMTRRFGRKISTHLPDPVFLATDGAAGFANRMTSYAFFTCIIAAATVGFILGHRFGISSVNFKMEEDTKTNQYSKFDSAVLTMHSLAALAIVVAFFFAYWMTRRFGRKISTHLRGAVFLAINRVVGSAIRLLNSPMLAFSFSAFRFRF